MKAKSHRQRTVYFPCFQRHRSVGWLCTIFAWLWCCITVVREIMACIGVFCLLAAPLLLELLVGDLGYKLLEREVT